MSLTEDDWLRQIAADPEDDAIRLIFADWLEERGDAARAEFIRVQVRLAALPENALERTDLTRREQELLTEYRDAWLAKVPKSFREKFTFQRGFAAHLECTSGQWLRSAKRLQQVCPLLEALTLHRVQNDQLGENRVSNLASSPQLARLTTLNLWNNRIGDSGASSLAASPHLARLTTLKLGYNQIGDSGAAALASSPHLARLITLNLVANQIGDRGASALIVSPYLTQLTTLNLRHNQIGDAVATALRKRFGNGVWLGASFRALPSR